MKDLTQGKEATVIFKFAMPMLIGNIFQQLYNMVDSIVVGQYLGREALAAVGASFPIIFSICAMVMGLTIGGSVVISQYFGARQYEKVRRASDTINITLFVSGIVVSLAGWFFSEDLFRLINLPEEIIPDATDYFSTLILTSAIPMFCYNGVAAVLRGIGNSKTPLYFLILSTILNAGLDYLFVAEFGWGIKGAAWATAIATLLSWWATLAYLYRTRSLVRLSLRNLVFDKTVFRESMRIGLPSGVQQTFVGLGGLALMVIVNRFGVNTIAAYTAAGRVDMFVAMPAMNFAAALSGFVGQNIGAGRYERIKRGLNATLIMTNITCVFTTLVMLLFGKQIMHLFVDTGSADSMEVIRIGYEYLVIICSFYFLFCTMFTLNGVMRGAGATLVPMLFTLLGLWFVRVPVAYFLSQTKMAETGIWWSIVVGWVVALAGAYIYYKSGKWMKKDVLHHRRHAPEEDVENPDVSKDFTARI
ncbi:MAG: MATE family efflux transporter [Prevotellaceae bacterium]|jgi:putative MATE family efflux protein|nr:MATE family efflux transporter [Prevotellaceae bacterium]